MRRVLLLAYHFPPIGGAGTQRSLKFARYLPGFGWKATVVTGPGHAADRWTPRDASLTAELPSGTDVIRVPGPVPPPSSGRQARRERWLGHESGFARWWVSGALECGRRTDGVGAIVASMSPYETAAAAAALAHELAVPWVADLRDPWALDEMMVYPSGLHRRRELRHMRTALASAAAVVMNTPEAAAALTDTFPELRRRPVVAIPNGFDATDFESPTPSRRDGCFRIVHAGYLHTALGRRHRRTARGRRLLGGAITGVDILARSHVYLLQAVEALLADRPELARKLELHFVGASSEADRLAARCAIARFYGYVSHDEAVATVRSADLLFLPMHDLPPGRRSRIVPGKTYEYLASGVPLLAAVPDGDARDLLAAFPQVRLCRPTDASAMRSAIEAELGTWQHRGAAAATRAAAYDERLSRYERRVLTGGLAALLERISQGVAHPPALAGSLSA